MGCSLPIRVIPVLERGSAVPGHIRCNALHARCTECIFAFQVSGRGGVGRKTMNACVGGPWLCWARIRTSDSEGIQEAQRSLIGFRRNTERLRSGTLIEITGIRNVLLIFQTLHRYLHVFKTCRAVELYTGMRSSKPIMVSSMREGEGVGSVSVARRLTSNESRRREYSQALSSQAQPATCTRTGRELHST